MLALGCFRSFLARCSSFHVIPCSLYVVLCRFFPFVGRFRSSYVIRRFSKYGQTRVSGLEEKCDFFVINKSFWNGKSFFTINIGMKLTLLLNAVVLISSTENNHSIIFYSRALQACDFFHQSTVFCSLYRLFHALFSE